MKKKSIGEYISRNPFSAVRLDKGLLIVKPDKYDVCFFVNNQGIQVMDPQTREISPLFNVWGEKTNEESFFERPINFDKTFLENVLNIVTRITAHRYQKYAA